MTPQLDELALCSLSHNVTKLANVKHSTVAQRRHISTSILRLASTLAAS